MSLMNSTVSQNPDPVNTTVPISPLPTGTIFMYGWSHKSTIDYGDFIPFPTPYEYWTSVDELLESVRQEGQLLATPEFLKRIDNVIERGKSVDVYQSIDEFGIGHYIYVWAISPVGGAA